MQFADIFNTPVKAAYITFLGPLLGSIMRPFGGKLADRHGGALVTTITFASMIAGGGLIVKRRSRALIGLTGAVGSFGGVLVNMALRQSFLSSGSGTRAYVGFIAFYAICLAVTVLVYLRPKNTDLVGV